MYKERVREREREVVASVVTAACGEDIEQEVVTSVFIYCTFPDSDSLQSVGSRGFSLLGFSTLTYVVFPSSPLSSTSVLAIFCCSNTCARLWPSIVSWCICNNPQADREAVGAGTLRTATLETPASGPRAHVRPRVTDGGGGKDGNQDNAVTN